MLIAGAILAAVLAAQGAEAAKPTAAGQTEASAAAKPAQTPPEAKKICVTEAQLGSHFRKRICATQEEWDRRRERDAAEMAKASDRTAACTGSAC